jgi:hypothetical protein
VLSSHPVENSTAFLESPKPSTERGQLQVHVPLLTSFRSHWIRTSDQRPEATASRYLEMLELELPSIGRILRLLEKGPALPALNRASFS